jgi:chromosome segregation ATPase
MTKDQTNDAATETERDALREEYNAMEAELIALKNERADRDLNAYLKARRKAEAAVERERASLEQERDALRAELADVIQHRQSVCADYTELTQEFKGLLDERDALEEERDALRGKLVAMAAKHPREAVEVMEAQRNADAINQEAAETLDLILAAKAKMTEARKAAAAAMPDLSACLSSLDTLDSALREIGGE